MRVKMKYDPNLEDDENVISYKSEGEALVKLQAMLQQLEQESIRVIGYRRGKEFFLEVNEILFFETESDSVYAHTKAAQFEMKERLYELEKVLPPSFMRISKSTILNIPKLFTIESGIGGPREISFKGTEKIVYVSRKYYPMLKERMR